MNEIPFLKATATGTEKYQCVKAGAAGFVAITTAKTDIPLGFTQNKLAAGVQVVVCTHGLVRMKGEGAITFNDVLQPSDTVDGAVETHTDGTKVGRALETVADGEEFWGICRIQE